MDVKKKLEDAYNPDKQSRKEKVLIGLSGKLDSFVTAYLLKIQKYDLMAVTILNSWEELPGDQKDALSCHINSTTLDGIKDFCRGLNIPHQVIKASDEFQESVIEPWLGARVVGKRPAPCWSCHELRMKLLFGKMKEMGAQYLATGHYAKLFHNDTHGSVFVHTSNDEAHDQSSLLSRLPHEILQSLLLPLSDLTKKEVLKLAENFGVTEGEGRIKVHECLKWTGELAPVFEKRVPKKFLKEGDITSSDGLQSFGAHLGVHNHTLGEGLEVRDAQRTGKLVFGNYSYPDKRMILFEEGFFVRNRALITRCRFSEEVSWLEPMKGFLVLSDNKAVECWIHPKSLSSVFVELSEDVKLVNGEIVSVIKKKGKNSKIYLTGEVQLLPLEPVVDEEGEQSVPKVNHSIDF